MPNRTTLETYLFRMRRCAEKGDAEGMLHNLKLATTLALEDNPGTFAKVSPRTLLEIVQAENVLARRKAKAEQNDNEDEEDDFLKRLAELEEESDEE